MLRVGSQFDTFDELSQRLEEFQKVERVQLWVRDSRTVVAAAKRARRKCLNPALKYAELTYSCVFGGRRPSDTTKIHNQTSAGGCPFKVRLSTSADGQALVVKEINNAHNHEPGKKLHDEPRRLFKKTQQSRFSQDSVEGVGSFGAASVASSSSSSAITNMSAMHKQPIKLIVSKSRLNSTVSPFANLQQLHHQQPQQQQQNQQPLKLHVSLPQQAQRCFIKKQDPELIAEPSIITSDLVDGVESLYSFTEFGHRSYQYGNNNPVLNTPSSSSLSDTPESSKSSSPDNSTTNTPNNSPINSPTNSLSSAAEESVLNFHFPPSPISPNCAPSVSVKPREEEDRPLEPLYDLSEALEDGLASLPTFDSDELPHLPNFTHKFANFSRKQESLVNEKSGGQSNQSASVGCSGSKSNITGAVTHFPVVRTLTSSSNSIRVGFPANTSLCRPRTITTPNGSYYINSETGLVKTVKAHGGGGGGSDASNGQATSIQYNLVSSKVTAGLGSGARNAGKITIQHYMPSTTSTAVACSTATPNVVSKCATSNSDPYTRAVPVLVGIGSCAKTIQSAEQSVDCNAGSGSVASVGPIKNYRARIAKKPYSSGSVLKVVKSDSISSPIATVDRLINTVTPDKVKIGLNRFSVKNENECAASSACVGGTRKLFSETFVPSLEMDRVIEAAVDGFKSDSFGFDKTNPVNKMDQVISGGLEADLKIKNELVHGAGKDDFCDSLCDVTVKQELMDTCDALDNNGLLFVVDGLEPSLGEDIPLSPEDYFNVADLEKFDFNTF